MSSRVNVNEPPDAPEVMVLTSLRLLGSPVMRVMVTGPWASLHVRVNGLPSSTL
jgi:hypothetical protein